MQIILHFLCTGNFPTFLALQTSAIPPSVRVMFFIVQMFSMVICYSGQCLGPNCPGLDCLGPNCLIVKKGNSHPSCRKSGTGKFRTVIWQWGKLRGDEAVDIIPANPSWWTQKYSRGRRKRYISQFHFAKFKHHIFNQNCHIFSSFFPTIFLFL